MIFNLPPPAVTIAVSPDKQQGRLWSLVLAARGFPHRLRRRPEGWLILVPEEFSQAASEELRLYTEENLHWPPHKTLPPLISSYSDSLSFVLPPIAALIAFHAFTGEWTVGNRWFLVGALDRALVIGGEEWWRLITALTLHADGAHLLGNAVFGGLLALFLCHHMGRGLAWFSILLTAGVANGINLFLHPEPYHSVGFSTAVFCMVGMLGGMRVVRVGSKQEILLALGSAVGLLAFLGSTGDNTDLGAHFWGLLLGLGGGLALGLAGLIGRGKPSSACQWILLLAALTTIIGCWLKAIFS